LLVSDSPRRPSSRSIWCFIASGPVDDFARPVHEALAHAAVARRDAGLQQGLPLPQLGPLAVIGTVALQRQRDGAHAALGAQAQIHAEDVALVGHRLDDRHQVATDAREVLAVGEPPLEAAGRVALGPVHEHQIDVRGVVQLLAAELAHADDGQAGRLALVVEGRAVAGPRLGLRHAPGLGQAGVGQPGQLLGGHAEVGVTEEIAGADAEQVAILEPPQRVQARLARRERLQRLLQVRGEILREPHPHRARLEQPSQEGRPAAEGVGEELAAAP
jgi:hypothetical protein